MNIYEFRDGFRIGKRIRKSIDNVIKSNRFILGDNVKRFEDNLSKYLDVPYCVSTSSGTDALTIAVDCLDLNMGQTIITTPLTIKATFSGAKKNGMNISFSDIDIDTFNMDGGSIYKFIDRHVKCIIPVHLFGQCCEMNKILQHDIPVIEDACQALGAECHGRKAGTMGIIGCFSFYPTKIIGAMGDAGALVTSSSRIYKRAVSLRSHGSIEKNKYIYKYDGYCDRMDEIQAAILNIKLEYIDRIIGLHRKAAAYYSSMLSSICNVPTENSGMFNIYHKYVIKTKYRKNIIKLFEKNNIGYDIYYPKPFKSGYEKLSREVLAIPLFPFITRKEQDEVINLIFKASK